VPAGFCVDREPRSLGEMRAMPSHLPLGWVDLALICFFRFRLTVPGSGTVGAFPTWSETTTSACTLFTFVLKAHGGFGAGLRSFVT